MNRKSCIPYIQLLILFIIDTKGPICGYRIFQFLSKYGLASQPATVYVAIKKLYDNKYIMRKGSCVIKGKKLVRYVITSEGKKFKNELMGLFEIINNVLNEIPATDISSIASEYCESE